MTRMAYSSSQCKAVQKASSEPQNLVEALAGLMLSAATVQHVLLAAQAGLSRMGLPCSEDYLQEMMTQYDEDHDGTVDFDEFQRYVHHRRKSMRAAFEEMDFHHTGTIDQEDLVR